MKDQRPATICGARVVRVRDDDGFKFSLDDGSWALIRMSGTEPLMRVYAEAPTHERVEELIGALEHLSGARSAQPEGAPA